MLQPINIKTSAANQEVVRLLTGKLPTGTKENVIARIALGYSLQTGHKFGPDEFGVYDSKGKEYKDHILFDAASRDFYLALICQHYGIYKTSEHIAKYIKLHIDHGLELMDRFFEDNPATIFDFLIEYLDRGIGALENAEVPLGSVKNTNQHLNKSHFAEPLVLEVGQHPETQEPINLHLNDITRYNNCHMAVAGSSGTGKTRFALELLRQISQKSNGQVNFIFLDFKGLKKEDVDDMQPFFKATQANYIDAPQTPFPLNPLTFIDNINEKNRLMGINKFVDIIAKYSNLGKKQQQTLKTATKAAFASAQGGDYPSLGDICQNVANAMGNKQDTLTEVLESLSELELFAPRNSKTSFLTQNHYLSLSGDLPNSVRFTAIFLVINYIYNTFMNLENAPVSTNTQALRYVLLIDEAHVLFKERKSQDLLEKMLREIRSKGVSVVLLSQGIAEFNQPAFDFSSMCEIAFLLDIKDKTNTKSINRFLGLSDKEGVQAARSMEKINKGQAITNMKEWEKGRLVELSI